MKDTCETGILLRAAGLCKTYGIGQSAVKALGGVSLDIYRGELLVILGSSSGYLSLQKNLNAYMREGGYPDAVITTDVINRKEMEALLSLDGIEAVSARLVGDGIMVSPSGRYLSARLISFDEEDIQKFIWRIRRNRTVLILSISIFLLRTTGSARATPLPS
ncbi:MAG: hypothetical protein IKH57_01870 [Clostridia bacterium]|nr:hypothetical protein [Clostridia bacterium]